MPYVTFADLMDHALAYLGGDTARVNSDKARRAVLAAYNDLPTRHQWSFYRALGRLVTSAQYATGSVSFDYTGGSSERLITLSGGTFPAWAASGVVVIGDVPYEVDERLSSTTLTLESSSNPGEDVAAGTAYTLYRDTYPAPADLISASEVVLDTVGYGLQYRLANDWGTLRRRNTGPGKPLFFTFTGDGEPGGGMVWRLWPPPDAQYVMDFLYKRGARRMAIDRREDGLASCTSAGTTLAGTNTLFTAAMVGSVVRLAYDAKDAPTGNDGLNAYAQERVISAVASATSLTVSEAFDQTLSGVRYVVSDPADIDQQTALRFLYREIERQCRLASRMVPTEDEGREYARALMEAKAADSRYTGERVAGGEYLPRFRLRDYTPGTEFQ